MGPTAAGKTGLAVEMARDYPVDLISVDSALVYRGMDIGTAKPDAATLEVAPHRLINIRDPWQPYSAADFVADARKEIARSHQQHRVPVLVGGTMLYYRALRNGLSPMPAADPEVRAALEADARRLGWAAMHQRLKAVDAVSAERIHPNDPQRIQRALEVYEITGKSLTQWHEQQQADRPDWPELSIIVNPQPRAVLHARIEQRFQQMINEGFIEEVATLRSDPRIHADLPSMRAVGYRQVWDYLDGQFDRDELLQRGVFATRQLAKRQLTWLRKETGALRIERGELAEIRDSVDKCMTNGSTHRG
ncbi:MAG: tRNA dimethylallyltransferase [Lysobacteraceae bacterium]|nr:MAG: tRNA dimethylallyltransferase [Xanthomonadaceae bacterium]